MDVTDEPYEPFQHLTEEEQRRYQDALAGRLSEKLETVIKLVDELDRRDKQFLKLRLDAMFYKPPAMTREERERHEKSWRELREAADDLAADDDGEGPTVLEELWKMRGR